MKNNHLNEIFRDQSKFSTHKEYENNPTLFMKERWFGFSTYKKFAYDLLTPYQYQLDFIENIHKNSKTIVAKTRQMHLSSMMALYIAWYILFNKDKTVFIVSPNKSGSCHVLEQIKLILKNYYVEDIFNWKENFLTNNKSKLELSNGCKIITSGDSIDSCKGYIIDLLFIDNAAYFKEKNVINLFASLCISCLEKDSKIIIASSPYDNSYFNKLYLNANENNWNAIKLHWSIHPIFAKDIAPDTDRESPFQYTSTWFSETIKNIYQYNIHFIEQEVECVINYKEQVGKIKTISLRIENELFKRIQCHLKAPETASDYIRKLIEKDLDNQDYKI